MAKLLVCQHVPYEILGTLDPTLRTAGFRIRYVNFGRDPNAQPSLDGYDGLVILGGPMNVDQTAEHPHLTTELRLLERAFEAEIPVLGICLGAQLIAKALGAPVGPGGEKEIGWYEVVPTPAGRDDAMFADFQASEQIFQWHGDTFETPASAVHLASSAVCEHQAFRYGDNVVAFQFHLEVDEPMIARWLRVPGHVAEIEALGGAIDPAIIRTDTPRYITRLHELSESTFGAFINLFELPRSAPRLGSAHSTR